jgi:hypothetical protein
MDKIEYTHSAPVKHVAFHVVGFLACAALSVALPSFAQVPETNPGAPEPASVAGSSVDVPAQRSLVSAQQGKGLSVTSADGNFQATFRSRLQLRDTFVRYERGNALARTGGRHINEVNVKTLRFFAQGHVLSPDFKYSIQLAFGTGDFDKDSNSPIFDAFVEYVKLRDLNVRVGQFFVPFDRARTIREFALQFVDRQGVVRELTLDRDIGIMLSSQDLFGLQGRLAYHLFVGGGDGRNRVADLSNPHGPQKAGVLLVGRLAVRPMGPFDDDHEGDLDRSANPHLALGVGVGTNRSTTRPQSTYSTNGAAQAFRTGTFHYVHAAADVVFKWRGFSLLAEALLRDANKRRRTGVDASGAALTEHSREGYGYFVQAGQMLNDKIELTARLDDLYARKGTDPMLVALADSQGRQIGAGMNVYLNKHLLKLQSDYFAIFGTDNTDDIRHAVRLQLDASF